MSMPGMVADKAVFENLKVQQNAGTRFTGDYADDAERKGI
jgi:hypothetical protein